MSTEMTVEQKRELRDLYATLAEKNGYPMPASWNADLPAIKAAPFGALACVRHLVASESWP